MNEPSIDLTVRAVVARQLQLPPGDVTADLDLNDAVSDERAATALLTAMGHALDVRFPDDFLEGLQTYGDLSSAVRVSVGP